MFVRDHRVLPAAAIALMAIASCGGQLDDEAAPITGTPSWEEFRAGAERGPKGELVVEGDLAFPDEAALRGYYQRVWAAGGQALIVNTVTTGGVRVDDVWPFPDRMRLTYCLGAFSRAGVPEAMATAAASWERIVAVDFVQVSGGGACAPGAGVVFSVTEVPGTEGNGIVSTSFEPHVPADARKIVLLSSVVATLDSGPTQVEELLRHMLGHAMGFMHENVLTGCNEGFEKLHVRDGGTSGPHRLTGYDEQSVMHLPKCRSTPGGGYRQTLSDYRGAVQVYGLAPALVSVL